MFNFLRRRVTFVNVGVVLVLVFAMSGGAYAAGKYLITSTKQISPKVLKSLRGKAGPAGAQGATGSTGPAGANGKEGAPGANGTNGTNGINGENVTAKTISTSDKTKCGGLGGVEYTLSGKATVVCNGQTGFTSMLPKGKTETGAWEIYNLAEAEANNSTAISFPIQLAQPLDSGHVHVVKSGAASEECPGTAAKPEAAPGNLCVYESENLELGSLNAIFDPATYSGGASVAGAVLNSAANSVLTHGTYAVTAE